MRILDLAQHLDPVPFTVGPHRGDEIAKTVNRQQRGALERRNEEATREMCQMMFDIVELRAQVSFRDAEDTCEIDFHVTHFRSVRETILRLTKHAETRRCVQNLLVQVRRRIARDADVVHVLESHAGGIEAVTDRLFGKTRAVLDAIEALFFGGGDQSAVFDDCRRSIAVIRVDSEDVHRASIR